MNFTEVTLGSLQRLNTEANYFSFLRKDLSHEMAWYGASLMYDKIRDVVLEEEKIDPNKDLYLFTWAPDPSLLPDCHFELQHEYNLNYVSEYLSNCACGLACVEATQLGSPHYHGWYQLSDDPIKEKIRIILVKSMKRFGLVKITVSRGQYKVGSWSNAANCLCYYKKDLLQSQLFTIFNPVKPIVYPVYDWAALNMATFFRAEGKRESVADIEDKIALRDFYKDFYKNSL